ncbi:DNA methyltransferase [Mesorhizobium sp. M00.F.Ca.ET.170.01.1.1]|nr:DNA methyltransferase [Mesorhizobium sp. M00.F.Ca.ET.170.01.1.1]
MAAKLRAVDLYSGVGGWSLGLRMAGVDVVASYDRWRRANETNEINNGHPAITLDLRSLDLEMLPRDIDIVVGSPPCTQFSYANRGGGGDIGDGLEDIKVFLRVVQHLRPKAWAMENVPRVASILDHELKAGGRLAEFAHLEMSYRVINMEDFGLPQRRRRCIAGNFDFDLLAAYCSEVKRPTLGDVIAALGADHVVDPLYGIELSSNELVDHVPEDGLSPEEMRINRANKAEHPVYNRMPFPDPLSRSVRTITATCTRVSRESIIIKEPKGPEIYRRLTIRERACLQGFPIDFQFFGGSYAQKLTMIGNAVPPLFSYYVACALNRVPKAKASRISSRQTPVNSRGSKPMDTPPARSGATYPPTRTFRFAIPSLRLSSGVRFDLTNVSSSDEHLSWRVNFVFGTSKSIHKLDPGGALLTHIAPLLRGMPMLTENMRHLQEVFESFDVTNMQRVWCHQAEGEHPFQVLDVLDAAGTHVRDVLAGNLGTAQAIVASAVGLQHKDKVIELKGVERLRRNASVVAAGLLVGSIANISLSRTNGVTSRARKSPREFRFGS